MIPDHLIWYAIAWALLLSPGYVLILLIGAFLWNFRDKITIIVHKDGIWKK